MRRWLSSGLLAACALIAACGGGGSSAPAPVVVVTPPPPPRGSLVQSPSFIASFSASSLASAANSAQSGSTTITGEPRCGVNVHSLRYYTLGSLQEATEASTAVFVPTGASAACSGARPVLLYAHATSFDKTFDMARVDKFTEARLVALMYAAQGYLVVAPNYAGYAGSSLSYHPYLDATQQADDMVDALRAARLSWTALATSDNGKLALAGYSQGGHVALATLRAMQGRYASEFTVSAAAGMSGPYALLNMGDTIFGGQVTRSATSFLPMLSTAAARASQAVYGAASEMYEASYAVGIESLLPSLSTLESLFAAQKLPADNLFAADTGLRGFGIGSGNLVKTSYRNAVQADIQANPCTGASCTPGHPLRRWLQRNDLRNFTPAAPLMLCGGESDPTVPFANARLSATTGTVLLNIDDAPGLGSEYKTARSGFTAAKLALQLDALSHGDSPSEAVQKNYHAGLVPPFCMLAARDFLDAKLGR